MQSNLHVKHKAACRSPRPLHVAIIMDGNGRWATRRGLPRAAGHFAGVSTLREVGSAAPHLGIGTLTVYAFSADNWSRPAAEIDALMGLVRAYFERDLERLVRAGVRISVIGRRDRVPPDIAGAIAHAERVTAEGADLHLRIALDYSARDTILDAARAARSTADLTRDGFARLLAGTHASPDVDLLIRTSGEQRLSDFMLWECAYAELYFTETLWPDFGAEHLSDAIAAFEGRDRRFGGLSSGAAKSAETSL